MAAVSPSKLVRRPAARQSMVAAKRELKDEDGVPCVIYKQPRRMLVKVGKGSSGDTFEFKGAEWADVKAGSHDAAVPASVPNMPSLQLERPPSLAPDFELSDGAGS